MPSELRVDKISSTTSPYDPVFSTTGGALSHRNLIINGAMQVAQRGTSISDAADYTLDRFKTYQGFSNQDVTVSQEKDAPDEFKYSLKATCAVADGSAVADEYFGLATTLEVDDVAHLLWGNATHCTVSFWVKASFTGTLALNFNPDETNSGMSNDRLLYSTTYNINAASTWEYKTVTIPLSFLSSYAPLNSAGNLKGLEISWILDMISGGDRDNSTLGWNSTEARNMTTHSSATDTGFNTLNATFQITGVQLELGSVATPFEHRSFGEELDRCQRYYQKSYSIGVAPGASGANDGAISTRYYASVTNRMDASARFNKSMRTQPTVVIYDTQGNSGNVSNYASGTNHTGNKGVSSIYHRGENGWSGLTLAAATDNSIVFHYTAEAEL